MPAMRVRLRCALALSCLACATGLLPLRRGTGVRSETRARVSAVDDLAVSSFLEEPLRTRSGESDGAARTSGLQASGSDSLAFFAPDQSKPRPTDYDDFDDLLPPPMPEPVRRCPSCADLPGWMAGSGVSLGLVAGLWAVWA